MTGTLDTVWMIAGWSLGALAVLALLLAVLADPIRRRFRKARRCPKCWYDLSHTAGLTCSECGYTAKRERRLFKNRRSRGWLIGSLLLGVTAAVSFRVPAVQDRGLKALMPTTILVLMAPALESEGAYAIAQQSMMSSAYGGWSLPVAIGPPPDNLSAELAVRMENRELANWQWNLLQRRAIRACAAQFRRSYAPGETWRTTPEQLLAASIARHYPSDPGILSESHTLAGCQVITRPRCPAGQPLLVSIQPRACASAARITLQLSLPAESDRVLYREDFFPVESDSEHRKFERYWTDRLLLVSADPQPGEKFTLRLDGEFKFADEPAEPDAGTSITWAYNVPLDTTIAGDLDDVLVPVESEAFVHGFKTMERASIMNDELWLPRLWQVLELLDGATFAATFEVLHGDRVIASAQAWWAEGETMRPQPSSGALRITMMDDAPAPAARELDTLTLRITSNPEMALRRLDENRYWSGSFTVPVSWRPALEFNAPERGPAVEQPR